MADLLLGSVSGLAGLLIPNRSRPQAVFWGEGGKGGKRGEGCGRGAEREFPPKVTLAPPCCAPRRSD